MDATSSQVSVLVEELAELIADQSCTNKVSVPS